MSEMSKDVEYLFWSSNCNDSEDSSYTYKGITPFQAKVYKLMIQIPEGKVSTYKDLALALGSSPRAIGGACRRNPWAPKVPCHRVISATGFIGGFQGQWNSKMGPRGISKTLAPKTKSRKSSRTSDYQDSFHTDFVAKKIARLKAEGVAFDEQGNLAAPSKVLFNDFTLP